MQAAFTEALKRPGAAPRTEFRIRRKDGGQRWLEAFGNILLADAAVRGIVVNSRDITERRAAEERIRELNGLRGRFIMVVSHQLRTPLSGIRWNLESIIESDGRLPKAVKEVVRSSHENVVEIIRRINDMMTAIDVEQGRAVIRKAPASLEEAWGQYSSNGSAGARKRSLNAPTGHRQPLYRRPSSAPTGSER